ncbi:hypothetical protein OC834_006786 [Tilletia horrida]|nr:hypothetical protein OC834_006786 [Tilletia horrida]
MDTRFAEVSEAPEPGTQGQGAFTGASVAERAEDDSDAYDSDVDGANVDDSSYEEEDEEGRTTLESTTIEDLQVEVPQTSEMVDFLNRKIDQVSKEGALRTLAASISADLDASGVVFSDAEVESALVHLGLSDDGAQAVMELRSKDLAISGTSEPAEKLGQSTIVKLITRAWPNAQKNADDQSRVNEIYLRLFQVPIKAYLKALRSLDARRASADPKQWLTQQMGKVQRLEQQGNDSVILSYVGTSGVGNGHTRHASPIHIQTVLTFCGLDDSIKWANIFPGAEFDLDAPHFSLYQRKEKSLNFKFHNMKTLKHKISVSAGSDQIAPWLVVDILRQQNGKVSFGMHGT